MSTTRIFATAALQSELSLTNVSAKDQQQREHLAEQLRSFPSDALQYIRYFQTQIGCLNRCSFCSQSAGTSLWNMSRSDLANLIAALKTVGLELAFKDGTICDKPLNASTGTFSQEFSMPEYGLIGNKRADRPGVVYCYLDNDPASYPYLDDLIKWLYEDLGVKTRIATVGYSRLNQQITAMHSNISKNLAHCIAGFRLSISPYTYGWTQAAENIGSTSRNEFELDVAQLMSVYKNIFLSNKNGRKTSSIELRFRPLVIKSSVNIHQLNKRIIIQAGPYLIVQKNEAELKYASITDSKSRELNLSSQGEPFWLIYRKEKIVSQEFKNLISATDLSFKTNIISPLTTVLVHKFKNEDGDYYGINAERKNGRVTAKYFYPKTELRPNSGYIDGERYLLNLIIDANEKNANKTWHDIGELFIQLNAQAEFLRNDDTDASNYINNEIIPVVKSYVRMLRLANYPPAAFFDKNITVETGHICNLGRAYHEYKSIASREDLPLTPNNERAFSELEATEEQAWRVAISPVKLGFRLTKNALGKRNVYTDMPSILLERSDLSMTAKSEETSRERLFLSAEVIERISIKDSLSFPVIPGHIDHLYKK